jgi:hypothetical protein
MLAGSTGAQIPTVAATGYAIAVNGGTS